MRTSPHFLTECSLTRVLGVFTGPIIRLISGMRAKHGTNSVFLGNCGKFTLAEDLSDISDMTRIDLSGINSLEGEPLEKFPGVFFAYQSAFFGMFLTIHLCAVLHVCDVELPATRTHHIRTGNIQVLKSCPNLTSVNFEDCKKIEGEHISNELS